MGYWPLPPPPPRKLPLSPEKDNTSVLKVLHPSPVLKLLNSWSSNVLLPPSIWNKYEHEHLDTIIEWFKSENGANLPFDQLYK